MTCNVMTLQCCVVLLNIMLCEDLNIRVAICYDMLRCVALNALCYIMLCCAMSCFDVVFYGTLWYVISEYGTSCCVMLYHVVL